MINFVNDVLIPGLGIGMAYALIAAGFSVMERVTGVVNFAHGGLVSLAPVSVVGLVGLGWSPVAAFAGSLVIVIVAVLVEEWAAIRPFIRTASSLTWILSTFGVGIVIEEVAHIISGGVPANFPWHLGYQPMTLGPFRITGVTLTLILAAPVLITLIGLLYRHSRVGKMMEAVGQDFDGARSVGVDVAAMSRLSAVLSAVVAAITGWLIAPIFLASPEIGILLTFNGFVALAFGGVGSLPGALVGGTAVGLTVHAAGVALGPSWSNLMLFALLLAVYLVRPGGAFPPAHARRV
ncbi:branched-chain amino acid ABC transporter permease [Euzebya sp.]|uniref:branched-chain amino acid ABC transporter permease n=1 Tax=Euzebya sp. TaxID=1971409 RepID=UPI0035176908